jgi:hypothetical protein
MKLVLVLSLVSSTVFAALHPFHQRNREISAVISNEQVAAKLQGAPIDSIEYRLHNNVDFYIVKTSECTLATYLKTLPSNGVMGPKRFEVKVGQLRCN